MIPSSVVAHWVNEVTTTDTWAQIVARAWADETFHAQLLADPATVLYEAGLEVPTGMEVRVEEASGELEVTTPGTHLILSPKPAGMELAVERLGIEGGRICGGMCKFSACEGPYTPP